MEQGNAGWDDTGRARAQDANVGARDYLDLAAQSASSSADRIAEAARRSLDTAAESARSGLAWASEKASSLRDRNAALAKRVADTVAARPLAAAMVAIATAAAIGYIAGRAVRGRG